MGRRTYAKLSGYQLVHFESASLLNTARECPVRQIIGRLARCGAKLRSYEFLKDIISIIVITVALEQKFTSRNYALRRSHFENRG